MDGAALALWLWAAAPAPSIDSGWVQVRQTQTLTIWQRPTPGARVKESKVAGLIDAPPAAVAAVLADFAHYAEIMPYTAESRVLEAEADGGVVFYTVLAAPFVAKRDYTLRRTLQKVPTALEDGGQESDGQWRLSWDDASHHRLAPPPRPGMVRLTEVSGSWELRPYPGNKTYAVYRLLTDPGGALPGWLADRATQESLPKIFEALERWAGRSPYREAR